MKNKPIPLLDPKRCTCCETVFNAIPVESVHGDFGVYWNCGCGTSLMLRWAELAARTDMRLERFRGYAQHGWLHKVYKKLTVEERGLAEQFIVNNMRLNRDQFIPLVQRMFLNNPNKPKHWTEIMELLTCAGGGDTNAE